MTLVAYSISPIPHSSWECGGAYSKEPFNCASVFSDVISANHCESVLCNFTGTLFNHHDRGVNHGGLRGPDRPENM